MEWGGVWVEVLDLGLGLMLGVFDFYFFLCMGLVTPPLDFVGQSGYWQKQALGCLVSSLFSEKRRGFRPF